MCGSVCPRTTGREEPVLARHEAPQVSISPARQLSRALRCGRFSRDSWRRISLRAPSAADQTQPCKSGAKQRERLGFGHRAR